MRELTRGEPSEDLERRSSEACSAGQRIWSRMLLAGLLLAVIGPSPAAWAVPLAAAVDLNAEQRVLIAQLTADKAIAVVRERGIAAADQEKLYEQLKVKDQALRASERRAAGNAAKLAEVRKARDQIARERQALVAALADRDRTLAAEVRAYREVVTGIATSPDPRKQAALQRFADGEQREALADLDVIRHAVRAARRKAMDMADAAEARSVAELALQAHDLGNVTLDEVIARYEEVTGLDPGVTRDWIELERLYEERGQLDRARQAAESAYHSLAAGDERERVTVLEALGELAREAGDLAEARARFEEGLVIARKLAKDDPKLVQRHRDVGLGLEKLGDVAVEAGDLAEARARFEASLAISRALAEADPTSAEAQRDAGVTLSKLGDVAVQEGDLAEARARFEDSLALLRKLVGDDPGSIQAQRDVGISLQKLGKVAVEAGDLAEARARFRDSLAIFQKLTKGDPNSARSQRDVAVDLDKLGEVAVRSGDLAVARTRFEDSLMVRRKLAADNPGSAQAQRDVSISFEKLGGLALQAGDLVEARARFEDSLVIARKLAKANPNSADAQRDLSISVENLGDVAVRADDLMAARPRYEEDLAIRRKLAETNHNSAQAQRDLLLALVKLGWVKRDHALVNEALTIARGLARAGHLAPPDHGLVDWVIGIRDSLP